MNAVLGGRSSEVISGTAWASKPASAGEGETSLEVGGVVATAAPDLQHLRDRHCRRQQGGGNALGGEGREGGGGGFEAEGLHARSLRDGAGREGGQVELGQLGP